MHSRVLSFAAVSCCSHLSIEFVCVSPPFSARSSFLRPKQSNATAPRGCVPFSYQFSECLSVWQVHLISCPTSFSSYCGFLLLTVNHFRRPPPCRSTSAEKDKRSKIFPKMTDYEEQLPDDEKVRKGGFVHLPAIRQLECLSKNRVSPEAFFRVSRHDWTFTLKIKTSRFFAS